MSSFSFSFDLAKSLWRTDTNWVSNFVETTISKVTNALSIILQTTFYPEVMHYAMEFTWAFVLGYAHIFFALLLPQTLCDYAPNLILGTKVTEKGLRQSW